MTEYEMVSAVQGFWNTGLTVMLNFFSFLIAYLAAGYLVAHRLSLLMALFVTALLLAVAVNSLGLLATIMAAFQGLVGHMHEVNASGKGLAWLPLARGTATHNVWIAGAIALIVMALATIGAVYFFFECRAQNRKAEADPVGATPV